jgi:hypothetical protein
LPHSLAFGSHLLGEAAATVVRPLLPFHLRDATPEGWQDFVPLFTGETVGINYAEVDTQQAGREGI